MKHIAKIEAAPFAPCWADRVDEAATVEAHSLRFIALMQSIAADADKAREWAWANEARYAEDTGDLTTLYELIEDAAEEEAYSDWAQDFDRDGLIGVSDWREYAGGLFA